MMGYTQNYEDIKERVDVIMEAQECIREAISKIERAVHKTPFEEQARIIIGHLNCVKKENKENREKIKKEVKEKTKGEQI